MWMNEKFQCLGMIQGKKYYRVVLDHSHLQVLSFFVFGDLGQPILAPYNQGVPQACVYHAIFQEPPQPQHGCAR